ncbi:hypothetical protein LARI1_G009585, partial [Lachnellula arida]
EGQIADLERAIQYKQQALEATPESHPARARILENLGVSFSDRFRQEGQIADRLRALDVFEMAIDCKSSSPRNRLSAGRRLLDNYIANKSWSKCAQVVETLLQILPEVTPPSQSRQDMQHVLEGLSDLASISASVLLKAGKPSSEALKALEQGRGIIASLMLDARSDTSKLNEEHPGLCSQYKRCQEQIENLRVESASSEINSQQSYAVKSFERFLLPLTPKEIQALARDGPIICFNVSNISSEAFLITTVYIRVLTLPSLDRSIVKLALDFLATRGNSARRDASLVESTEDEQLPRLDQSSELRSLWEIAVKPVLQEIGLLKPKNNQDKLPRIWWVGGGMMSLLPLHAAGLHDEGSTDNTLSHVISSYAPTLKALQFIRNRPIFSLHAQKPTIMVVSMPETPGNKPLKVDDEVAAIQRHGGPLVSITHLKNPTKLDVLDRLKSCTIAHFACHGLADEVEPAKSALIVGRETQELLTINDLDTISHDSAQIAYLSACSTAEMKAQNLVNESIHLASTFQLSGFPHVIGTLWGANDTAAVEIASKFYEGLLQEGGSGGKSVAQALHDAVIDFRNKDRNRAQTSKWAPFIHLGC